MVKKKFTFLHARFNIDSIYGPYSLEGVDIFAHSFVLMKDGQTVATVNKKFFSLSDTYGVEITSDTDHAFILALVIIIDQVLHDNKNQYDN